MSRIRVDELINQGNSGAPLAVEGITIPASKQLELYGSISLSGDLGVNGQVLARSSTGLTWANVPLTDNDTTYSLSAIDGVNSVTEKVIRLSAGGSGTGNTDVVLVAGTNVNLVRSNERITINSTFTNTDTITRVKTGGNNYVTGDVEFVAGGDLNIVQSGRRFTFSVTDDNTEYVGESGVIVTTDNKIRIGQPVAPQDAVTFAQVTVTGNLNVQGTTITSQQSVITTTDKFINLNDVLQPSDTIANGGGIRLKGSTDHTITWSDPDDSWETTENWNLALNREYRINNVKVLDATSLGINVTSSSLSAVGVLTIGRWQAETIDIAYGGTGQTTANEAINALLPSQSANDGKYLRTDGQDTSWAAIPPTYSGWNVGDGTLSVNVPDATSVNIVGTGATTVSLDNVNRILTVDSSNTQYTVAIENTQNLNEKEVRLTGTDANYSSVSFAAGTGVDLTRLGNRLTFSVAQELGASATPDFAGLNVSGTTNSTYYTGSGAQLTGLTGVANGIYGSNVQIPVISVDPNGRISNISTVAASSQSLAGVVAGGVDDSIQYNVNGSFAGTNKFKYNPTSSVLSLEGFLNVDNATIPDFTTTRIKVEDSLSLPNLTNSERDSLNVINGTIIFNNAVNKVQVYKDGVWLTVGPLDISTGLLGDLANVSDVAPATGQVLKWNGTAWAPGTDIEGAGGGGGIARSDLAAITNTPIPGNTIGSLQYSDVSGIFTYTPPDTSNFLTSFTETDPIFSASAASSISTTQVNQWNAAYSWGDHRQAGYLSSAYQETTTLDIALQRGNTTSRDIITTGKVYFSNRFDTLSDLNLVNAGTYHGMFAHVHSEGHGYFAHGGNWVQLLDTTATIGDLGDVNSTNVQTGQVLKWNGSSWVPAAVGGTVGDISVTINAAFEGGSLAYDPIGYILEYTPADLSQKIEDISASPIGELSNVSATPATQDQILVWNGTVWAPTTLNLGIQLTDLSIASSNPPSGVGSIFYNSTNGEFTYTPPDLSGYLTSYTETDPIFTASAASGIALQDISQWNEAYGWGNHGTQGYLTSLGSINGHTDVNLGSVALTQGKGLAWDIGSSAFIPVDLAPSNAIPLTSLSVSIGTPGAPSLTYDNTTGVFSYTPPALSTYLNDSTFTSSGLMKRGTLTGTYEIVADNSTNWNTAYGWGNHATQNYLTSISSLSIQDLSDVATVASITTGHVLKWNGTQWAPAVDTAGAGGTGIALTDLSASTASPSSTTSLSYNNLTGDFTYTPPDLSGFATKNFADGEYLRFGNANDLEIVHTGTHSYISDVGTGGLFIEGSYVEIGGQGANSTINIGINGNTKIEVTSDVEINTNLTVTGTMDSVSKHTDVTVSSPGGGQLLRYNGTTSQWENWTPNYLVTESQTLDNILAQGNTTTRDIDTTGKVLFSNVYTNLTDLPSASTYHGMFAHVHNTGRGYFAHGGSWIPLANQTDVANASNWDTAYGWGDHAAVGYLTSFTETSHADVVVDGDFTSNGLMKRTAAGTYAIVIDNSTAWNTAYNWGDHAAAGYLDNTYAETQTLDNVVALGNSTARDIQMLDNAELQFGTGSTPSQIFATSGNEVYFRNTQGTGAGGGVQIQGRTGVHIYGGGTAGTNIAASFELGSSLLKYQGSTRLTTTSTGVTISGSLTAGGLTYPTTNGTNGQVLTSDGSGNVTWAAAAGGGASVTVSDSAPTGASAGDLWWKSDEGRLKIYYTDATPDTQWVDASPVGVATTLANGGSTITTNNVTTGDAIDFGTNNGTATAVRWKIAADGKLLPEANDTYDIGSATNKVRDLYLGPTSLHIGSLDISENSGKLVLPAVEMTGHLIPDTNSQYDLGSAEYKIRHLFLSSNSIYTDTGVLRVAQHAAGGTAQTATQVFTLAKIKEAVAASNTFAEFKTFIENLVDN